MHEWFSKTKYIAEGYKSSPIKTAPERNFELEPEVHVLTHEETNEHRNHIAYNL